MNQFSPWLPNYAICFFFHLTLGIIVVIMATLFQLREPTLLRPQSETRWIFTVWESYCPINFMFIWKWMDTASYSSTKLLFWDFRILGVVNVRKQENNRRMQRQSRCDLNKDANPKNARKRLKIMKTRLNGKMRRNNKNGKKRWIFTKSIELVIIF